MKSSCIWLPMFEHWQQNLPLADAPKSHSEKVPLKLVDILPKWAASRQHQSQQMSEGDEEGDGATKQVG